MKLKDIQGFEGLYSISDDGSVFSLHHGFKPLTPHMKKCGYAYVGLRRGSSHKPSYRRVHRLVAEAFIANPDGKPQVNHLDGDKSNNRASNLEWVTASENMAHASENGLLITGQDHHESKLSDEQVKEIYLSNLSYKKTAALFPICAQTVCNIKKRRIYRAVTDGL